MTQHRDSLLQYVTERTGIELSRGGLLTALESYVDRRVSELGLASRSSYLQELRNNDETELERLIEIVSVPHTWFFRDLGQMDALGELLVTLNPARRVLQIWVPACATGEDAYSLALLTHDLKREARIVGSDLCPRSLRFANMGQYSSFALRDLPAQHWQHFQKKEREFAIKHEIKHKVQFRSHNLLDPPLSAEDGWDLILCRNVLIYFSAQTGMAVAERLGHSLSSSGVVAFGAGELIGPPPRGLLSWPVRGRVFFTKTRAAPTPVSDVATKPAPASWVKEPKSWTKDAGVTVQSGPPQAAVLHEPSAALAARALLSAHAPAHIADEVLKYSTAEPLNAELRMMSGMALYAAGDFRRSQTELRAALLLDDDLWPAALYHGLCLESMGLPELARSEYRHVARLLTGRDQVAPLPPSVRPLAQDLLELARSKIRLFA